MEKHIRISHETNSNKEIIGYTLHKYGCKDLSVLRFEKDQLKDAFNKVVELNLPFCSSHPVTYEWIKGGYPRELLMVPDILSGFVDNIYKAKDSLIATGIIIHRETLSISHCQQSNDVYHIPFHVGYYVYTGKHLKDQVFADKSFDTDYDAERFVIQTIDKDGPYTDAEQAAISCYDDYRHLLYSMARQERYEKLLSLSDKGVYVLDTRGCWVYAPGKTKEEAEKIYISLADETSENERQTSFFS